MPSSTVVSYEWTCPGDFCDAGGVDPEWAARIQQGNILVVNIRNDKDSGEYNCIAMGDTEELGSATYTLAAVTGMSTTTRNHCYYIHKYKISVPSCHQSTMFTFMYLQKLNLTLFGVVMHDYYTILSAYCTIVTQ